MLTVFYCKAVIIMERFIVKKLTLVFLAFCLFSIVSLFAQSKQSSRQTLSPDVEQRIRRIENGLLLPVVVKGQPIEVMKLADRMQFFKTPGVSIAFINNGQIEWARGYGVREAGSREPVMTETLFKQARSASPSRRLPLCGLCRRESSLWTRT